MVLCDHTQRPYIWKQAIRSKISAENPCNREPSTYGTTLADGLSLSITVEQACNDKAARQLLKELKKLPSDRRSARVGDRRYSDYELCVHLFSCVRLKVCVCVCSEPDKLKRKYSAARCETHDFAPFLAQALPWHVDCVGPP